MSTRRLVALASACACGLAIASVPPVIGGFNTTRAGAMSLAGGTDVMLLSSSLEIAFPGATLTGVGTLSDSYLAGVDVLFLTSGKKHSGASNAISPLTAAERTALLNFVKSGKGAIIAIDNSDFEAANESILDAFALDASGKLGASEPLALGDTAESAIVNGRFGAIASLPTFWPGVVDNASSDRVVGRFTNDLAGLTIIPRDAISAGSGPVVIVSDMSTLVNTYLAGDAMALMLNAVSDMAGYCTSDFNLDGFVNGDDYDAFASAFDLATFEADINRDGFVNGDDYDTFASAFDAGC
ncbi:MAG: hypothetical protein IT434_01260 [Phycisphaerales bacterium]|jgi:hypothetical protein|nr:hypothetical protein [Phycisphaerales bacterium]